MSEGLIAELEAIVGPENISTRAEDLLCGSYEATPLMEYRPDLILAPRTAEQVSEILLLANRHRIPVTPRGAGTSLAGNSLAVAGGICLDMSSMKAILEFDGANQTIAVEPGVVCDTLNDYLADRGFFFPPDPASSSAATIGGMVSNNSGGNRALKYGVTRDHVLWLEAVLPTGEVIRTGSRTLKSVSGYDLTRLLVGSEGTLAVITKVGLRVMPLPEARAVSLYIFDDVEGAVGAAVEIKSSGILPSMLEFMDETSTKASFEYAKMDYPEGCAVIVECDGWREAVEREAESIHRIALRRRPKFFERASSPEEGERLISARKAALPALSRAAPTIFMEDFTVPVTKIPEAYARIARIPEELDAPISISTFGHIGEGNLHPNFLFDGNDPEQRRAFLKALDLLYREVVIPLGGSITGEHGVGFSRGDYIELEHGAKSVGLMREIKRIFDPNMILNPYKAKGGPWPPPMGIGGLH
ncbi:MAG: FAD-linked oxidase C-terminal domain-containing protein [Candidatus Bathyarchaeia archaeon]